MLCGHPGQLFVDIATVQFIHTSIYIYLIILRAEVTLPSLHVKDRENEGH